MEVNVIDNNLKIDRIYFYYMLSLYNFKSKIQFNFTNIFFGDKVVENINY